MLKKAEIMRLQQVEHIISEKDILRSLSHPFIVNMAGSFQDTSHLFMVLEFIVGGEFFTHLRRAGRFDSNTSRFYGAQIVDIFAYLHGEDIIYRDLKPENILVARDGYLKLTDFGFAKRVAFKTYTLCGTPEYIAPEVLLNKGHGKGVDWWTLGILLFEMMAGQPPFVDDDPMGIYQQILAGKVTFPRQFDRGAKSLVKKLLVLDLTRRLGCYKGGADDVKKHKWFNGFDWAALVGKTMEAPIVPNIQSDADTSNFDPYPDSTEEPPIPVYKNGDPFESF
jgi:serine/threonine protein kinase